MILSLASAANGDLWVGTPDGLNRIRDGAIAAFTSADGLPDDFIRSLFADADGSLWIGTRRGLTHWQTDAGRPGAGGLGTHMETFTHANGLGSDLVGAMVRDSLGEMCGLQHFPVCRGCTVARLTITRPRTGLSSNVVTALFASTAMARF